MDYFPWQDLPGREWELLMELSFMGFVCLMWWWNVLGVLFKERGKTLNVGGEEKHTNTQCNLVCYYLGFGLKKYICEDLCISYFPNDWSVLLLLNHEGACSIYKGKKNQNQTNPQCSIAVFYCFSFYHFLTVIRSLSSQYWNHCSRQCFLCFKLTFFWSFLPHSARDSTFPSVLFWVTLGN